MSKIYNTSKISNLSCYTIDDVCILYAKKKLHSQTVRKWLKKGLVVIDSHKPTLIHGIDLRQFLSDINKENRRKVEFEEFFCFACKEAHIPLNRTIYVDYKQQYIKAKALCPKTKKIMNKSFSISDFSALKNFFKVEPLLRLYDSLNTPLETQIGCKTAKQENESTCMQGEFNYE